MASDKVLDEIFADLDAAESEELKLTISGEAIARLNEQLHKAAAGSEEAVILANRILIITHVHTQLLMNTDEMAQAPITMVGELCFILTHKVNPERLPVIYLGSLLNSVQMTMALTYQVSNVMDEHVLGHLAACVAMLGELSVVTYDKLSTQFDLSPYKQDIEMVRSMLEQFTDEDRRFDGQEITPHLALDIFYDVLARFTACEFIDKGLFEPD